MKKLTLQPLFYLASRNVLTIQTGKRGIINLKCHRDCRLVDGQGRHRLNRRRITNGIRNL